MNEDSRRWEKMKKHQTSAAQDLLRSQERFCLNACHRYLNRVSMKSNIWMLGDKAEKTAALFVYVKQCLMPVLCGCTEIPPPGFMKSLLGTIPLHSVQGQTNDVEITETALEKFGLHAAEKTDYDMMHLDRPPSGFHGAGPDGIVIRKPELHDMPALAALHGAYEREEVLPAASQFNAALSLLNTERLFQNEQMLVAELKGRLVGKINTNAEAFTRYQIGGVYVHPDCRGLGIARRMTGEFAARLVSQGKFVSLFVKKSNHSARRVYQRIGFALQGSYRIDYF